MDDLQARVLDLLNGHFKLEPVAVAPELAVTTFPLKALEMQLFNWRARGIHKIYCMRLKVKVPELDVLGMAIYPDTCFAMPLFQFDLSCTRRKVVTYINLISLFDDERYRRHYIAPLIPLHDRYKHFPPQKMPEWMLAYQNPCTIYAMPDRNLLEDIKRCVIDYLVCYIEGFARADAVSEQPYRERIEEAHRRFTTDLVTKDRSQIMLGKIIGRKKASRIFHEVLV